MVDRQSTVELMIPKEEHAWVVFPYVSGRLLE